MDAPPLTDAEKARQAYADWRDLFLIAFGGVCSQPGKAGELVQRAALLADAATELLARRLPPG